MSDVITTSTATPNEPPQSLINIGHVVYACYALGFFIGLSWIVGVIIAYVKRDEATGTWQESHFRWQIRTFWWGLLWGFLFTVVAIILTFTVIGIPVAIVLGCVYAIWLIYRVVRGWIVLNDRKPLPV